MILGTAGRNESPRALCCSVVNQLAIEVVLSLGCLLCLGMGAKEGVVLSDADIHPATAVWWIPDRVVTRRGANARQLLGGLQEALGGLSVGKVPDAHQVVLVEPRL